jgi:hypothetical protein
LFFVENILSLNRNHIIRTYRKNILIIFSSYQMPLPQRLRLLRPYLWIFYRGQRGVFTALRNHHCHRQTDARRRIHNISVLRQLDIVALIPRARNPVFEFELGDF